MVNWVRFSATIVPSKLAKFVACKWSVLVESKILLMSPALSIGSLVWSKNLRKVSEALALDVNMVNRRRRRT